MNICGSSLRLQINRRNWEFYSYYHELQAWSQIRGNVADIVRHKGKYHEHDEYSDRNQQQQQRRRRQRRQDQRQNEHRNGEAEKRKEWLHTEIIRRERFPSVHHHWLLRPLDNKTSSSCSRFHHSTNNSWQFVLVTQRLKMHLNSTCRAFISLMINWSADPELYIQSITINTRKRWVNQLRVLWLVNKQAPKEEAVHTYDLWSLIPPLHSWGGQEIMWKVEMRSCEKRRGENVMLIMILFTFPAFLFLQA